ncbi:MAG TPA: DUF1003 domain-containing protein [Gaiellaceae bacterium]|nr:DUF1003 domain-containing protein [Gaiellaceae bacterium]
MTAPATQAAPATVPDHHPVVIQVAAERYENVQLRVADAITGFAGSMKFVYLHILLFGGWMLVFEQSPWPTLTLVVSLEAIFLSTFVLISQNRADAKRRAIADQQWQTVQEEDRQNEELLDLSRQTLDLTKAIHSMAAQIDPEASNWQRSSAASIANPPKETR